MEPPRSPYKPLHLSWSRLRTHSECPAKGGLVAAGHKSPITDVRNYFPGTVADRCMRQWLTLENPQKGWMAGNVDKILAAEEKTAVSTGDGVVKWRNAGDRAEVHDMCRQAVNRLEVDLWELLWMGNPASMQCEWDPAPRFKVPCTIPYRGGKVQIFLVGEIDLLLRRPRDTAQGRTWSTEVWDLKTTRDSQYWRKTLGQLVFYEIAVWCMKKEWPERSGLLQPLCEDTAPEWNFTMEHRTQMLQRIVSVATDILAGRLDPKPEKARCGYCEVRHACPVKGGGRGRVTMARGVPGA